MTITVNPKTTPTFNQVAAICNGATLSPLPATSIEGIAGSWSPALNNTATTTYTFTPAAGQCANTTTMTITVNPKVAAPVTTSDIRCNPGIVTLSGIGTGIVKWYADANLLNEISTGINFSPSLPATTIFYVTNTVGTCVSNYTTCTGIITNDKTESTTELFLCPELLPYQWNGQSYTHSGLYQVTLTNLSGCDSIARLNLKIFTTCQDIYFPSGFSPNGDGINDKFGPIGDLNAISKYTITICNRWGEIVFKSGNPYEKWDGTVKKGNTSDTGNFVWIATYEYKGQKKSVKGNVVLIK